MSVVSREPPHIRVRAAVKTMAPAEVFKSSMARPAIEALIGELSQKIQQETNESKLRGLMTQIGQVEQWLAGVCALNGTAYALVVEVVKNGSEREVIQMCMEIYFSVYDPSAESPDASKKDKPTLTLPWFVGSLKEWITRCEDNLRASGFTPTRWLSTISAQENNRARRPRSAYTLSLPPDYDTAMAGTLATVREEEEGVATLGTQGAAPRAERPVPPRSPGASRSLRGEDERVLGLLRDLAPDSEEDQRDFLPPPQSIPHRIPAKKLLSVERLLGFMSSFRSGSNSGSNAGSNMGSGTSSARRAQPSSPAPSGMVDLSTAFEPYRPSPSPSSRTRPPAASRGGTAYSPAISSGQPSPSAKVTLSPSGFGTRTPASPSAPHQQHAGHYRAVTPEKGRANVQGGRVYPELQERRFDLLGPNPIPLVFSAADQSGDTCSMDLHVTNVVVKSARP